MSLSRDYTIRFFADASQAMPGFAAVKRELDQLKNSASGTANTINQVGQQFQMLPATANTGIESISKSTGFLNRTFMGLNVELVASLAAFRGLQEGIQILFDLGDRANKVREALKDMAEEAAKFRDENRPIAHLLGHDGPDDEITAGTAKFALTAGMSLSDARKFLHTYHSSRPAGAQKGHVGPEGADEETQQKVAAEIAEAGARFAQRYQLKPTTAGDITGILTQFGRVESGEAASQQLGRIAYGLEQGRGNVEDLMRAFVNVAGATVEEDLGPIKDLDTLAILHGVMSLHHGPREAATYLKKSLRQLRAFEGPQGPGIREMGITPDMEGTQAYGKLHEYLAERQEQGVAPDLALQSIGFRDKAGIQALIEVHSNMDILGLRKEEQAKITGKSVQAQDDAYFTRNVDGQRRLVKAREEAGKFLIGHHRERAELGRLAAVVRMRDEGRLHSGEQLIADKIIELGGLLPKLGIPAQMEQRINQESIDLLLQEARNVGLGEEADAWSKRIESAYLKGGKIGGDRELYDTITPEMFNDLSQKVMDRGGQPFGNSGSISLKLGEIARPEAEKKRLESFKLPRAPHPGAPGGNKPGAGAPAAGPDGAPAGGTGPVSQNMQLGEVVSGLAALLDAVQEQTDEMRRSVDLGPFGTHPDFGGGFTPKRA